MAGVLSNTRLRFVRVWKKYLNSIHARLPRASLMRRPVMTEYDRHLHKRIDLTKWVLYATRPILCYLLGTK